MKFWYAQWCCGNDSWTKKAFQIANCFWEPQIVFFDPGTAEKDQKKATYKYGMKFTLRLDEPGGTASATQNMQDHS